MDVRKCVHADPTAMFAASYAAVEQDATDAVGSRHSVIAAEAAIVAAVQRRLGACTVDLSGPQVAKAHLTTSPSYARTILPLTHPSTHPPILAPLPSAEPVSSLLPLLHTAVAISHHAPSSALSASAAALQNTSTMTPTQSTHLSSTEISLQPSSSTVIRSPSSPAALLHGVGTACYPSLPPFTESCRASTLGISWGPQLAPVPEGSSAFCAAPMLHMTRTGSLVSGCGPEIHTGDLLDFTASATALGLLCLPATWSVLSASSDWGDITLDRGTWTGDVDNTATPHVISALPPTQQQQQQQQQQPLQYPLQQQQEKDGPQIGTLCGPMGQRGVSGHRYGGVDSNALKSRVDTAHRSGGGASIAVGSKEDSEACGGAAVGRYGTLMMSSADWRCTELYDMCESLTMTRISKLRGMHGGGTSRDNFATKNCTRGEMPPAAIADAPVLEVAPVAGNQIHGDCDIKNVGATVSTTTTASTFNGNCAKTFPRSPQLSSFPPSTPPTLHSPPPHVCLKDRLAATDAHFNKGRAAAAAVTPGNNSGGGGGGTWSTALDALFENVTPRTDCYALPVTLTAAASSSGGYDVFSAPTATCSCSCVERRGKGAVLVLAIRRWTDHFRSRVSFQERQGYGQDSSADTTLPDSSTRTSPASGVMSSLRLSPQSSPSGRTQVKPLQQLQPQAKPGQDARASSRMTSPNHQACAASTPPQQQRSPGTVQSVPHKHAVPWSLTCTTDGCETEEAPERVCGDRSAVVAALGRGSEPILRSGSGQDAVNVSKRTHGTTLPAGCTVGRVEEPGASLEVDGQRFGQHDCDTDGVNAAVATATPTVGISCMAGLVGVAAEGVEEVYGNGQLTITSTLSGPDSEVGADVDKGGGGGLGCKCGQVTAAAAFPGAVKLAVPYNQHSRLSMCDPSISGGSGASGGGSRRRVLRGPLRLLRALCGARSFTRRSRSPGSSSRSGGCYSPGGSGGYSPRGHFGLRLTSRSDTSVRGCGRGFSAVALSGSTNLTAVATDGGVGGGGGGQYGSELEMGLRRDRLHRIAPLAAAVFSR